MLRKIIIITMLMGFVAMAVAAAPVPQHKVYRNTALGVEFSVPETWMELKMPSPIIAVFVEPPQGEEKRTATVTLVVEELPSPVDLAKYVEENIKSTQAAVDKYRVRSREFKTINGIAAAVLNASWITEDGRTVYLDQMIAVRKDKVFILNCGTAKDKYQRYSGEFTHIIESFTFTENK